MAELDQLWVNMLDAASKKAVESGRHDVADYLRLKLANDTIRTTAVAWFFESAIEAASQASLPHPNLKIERKQPHSFAIGTANMVGALIEVKLGVRCVVFEAGWVRTPSDGIMRNGSLAHARIRHFGLPRQNAEFRLVRAEPLPVWRDDNGAELRTEEINRHIEMFLGG